ncbi:MAG TPA: glycosyltransferase, partial [Bacteroidetes bacterium]|nr:glycosyltransferase [Bacteroidota bacterium]HEX05606.1 glycosyltransferase [Bacteroidota bacterium]
MGSLFHQGTNSFLSWDLVHIPHTAPYHEERPLLSVLLDLLCSLVVTSNRLGCPMRILMVYNDYQQPGGEKVAFHNECNLLREKGHEVVVYSRSNDEVEGMNPLKMFSQMIWNRQAYTEIRELIRQNNIEIMHVHNVHLVISPSIFHAASAEGIPSIFTLHNFRLLCPAANLFRNGQLCEDCIGKVVAINGIMHKCYRDKRSTTVGVAAMQTIHRSIGTWHKKVTRFIALTEFTRSKYVAGNLPEHKIVIKPNFLDNPQDYAWDPDREAPYALCVGRLCQGKGVHVLLEAWQRNHPGIGLKIVGSGETEDELHKQGEGLEGVEFMSQLDHSEVFNLLRRATLFLMPSIYYECNPFALIESQAIGTPAVV